MARVGKKDGVSTVIRDPTLEEDCPGLRESPYSVTSQRDPGYNCIAFAVGDLNLWVANS